MLACQSLQVAEEQASFAIVLSFSINQGNTVTHLPNLSVNKATQMQI